MKKIVQITKKTVTKTIVRAKNEFVLPDHMQVFRTLQHFGFINLRRPESTHLEQKIISKYTDKAHIIDSLIIQKKVLDKTLETYTFPAHIGYSVDKDTYTYHIVGTKKSIYDALAIEAGYSVAQELLGAKIELLVELNFVGDKESVQKFTKELQHFLKKYADGVPKAVSAIAKKDVYAAYRLLEGVEVKSKSKKAESEPISIPNPIDHLSEASRAEFKEIMEYIESLDMNFRIQPFLFDSPEVWSGIIFSIQPLDKSKGAMLNIQGGRHDIMSKKILNKKESPILSVSITGLKKVPQPKKVIKIINDNDIKFFYAQLGPEARFKTLKVMDMMRCAHIPMHHALSKEKISAQLMHAERLNVPYLLLVGHREALQNSVMVRNMKNLSQESIEIEKLIEHLKTLL